MLLNISLASATTIYEQRYGKNWNLQSEGIHAEVEVLGETIFSNPQSVDFFNVSIRFFPRETGDQKIIQSETFPSRATRSHEETLLNFLFRHPAQERIQYGIRSEVRTTTELQNIPTLPYPIQNIPSEVRHYILPSATIDSNHPTVIQKAQELTARETNLYRAVMNIALWVNENVEYNLTTQTEQASFNSSWVLENRYGVCDEITNLFIGLLRASGIPARFISGLAYTSVDYVENNWGPHGWAEVYFPSVGWVPFDITYSQYGFVDATHIVFGHADDATADSSLYQWVERGSSIDIKPLITKTTLYNPIGTVDEQISMEVETFSNHIGIGSYNLITLSATNNRNSYVTHSFTLSNVNMIDIIGENKKEIIFRPYETKKIHWITRADPTAQRGFRYTIPVEITSTLATKQVQTSYTVDEYGIQLQRQELQAIAQTERISDQESCLSVMCSANNEDVLYVGEQATLSCRVNNACESIARNVSICLNNQCNRMSIQANDHYITQHRHTVTNPGAEIIVFSIYHENKQETAVTIMEVLDKPALSINDFHAPRKATYTDNLNITFILDKESLSHPKNAHIHLFNPEFSLRTSMAEDLIIPTIEEQTRINLALTGAILNIGENEMFIYIPYEDERGNRYAIRHDFTVSLTDVTILQRIAIYTRRFTNWVERLFI
ncbi:MAG: transglutaminase-like domain-containing protein [Candidatus Woesearchaeota archaeon]